MTAPIDAGMLAHACAITERVMSRVEPDQFAGPTPCSQWNVSDSMYHMVSSTDFFGDAAENGAVADDKYWPEYRPEELLPAFRRHASRLVAAFRAPGAMGKPMVILAGPPTAQFCLEVAVSERLVHAWDLAAATGQSFGEDGSYIAEALLSSPDYLAINEEVRASSTPPFSARLALAENASAVDRLVAYLGRDPRRWPRFDPPT